MLRSPAPPPPLVVDDDHPVRRDVCSETVRRVYPDLPVHGTARDRQNYLDELDRRAYEEIRHVFPSLKPSSASRSPEAQHARTSST